jgi:hypothetical protein
MDQVVTVLEKPPQPAVISKGDFQSAALATYGSNHFLFVTWQTDFEKWLTTGYLPKYVELFLKKKHKMLNPRSVRRKLLSRPAPVVTEMPAESRRPEMLSAPKPKRRQRIRKSAEAPVQKTRPRSLWGKKEWDWRNWPDGKPPRRRKWLWGSKQWGKNT